jgi:hypothetical protein
MCTTQPHPSRQGPTAERFPTCNWNKALKQVLAGCEADMKCNTGIKPGGGTLTH